VGVHSHEEHLFAARQISRRKKRKRKFILHAFNRWQEIPTKEAPQRQLIAAQKGFC